MSNDVDGELPNNQTKDPPTHFSIPLGSASMATTTAPFSITRLPILKPPGPDTNYLDWILVINQVFKKAKLKYVLSPIDVKARPATWEEDNNTVCAAIFQIVDPANLRYCQGNPDDASAIWSALERAHQDSSTGGKVYWM
ncbi:hypothetical protein PSTG_14437 [Puccinia striiformis f. sp. tritici PST-78]|uniref:Retrotransposon Copia-like N-terminal domain-containing protein n=1 Tax=Puccinia striiformis f. sp. tritici PST-78 TaxID=1165861 RepID=A0A0L0UYP6_9BASI|nr:hypothetical protein PSTG_14437 [Puccinia striiformis f. sp. tritici PST-78]